MIPFCPGPIGPFATLAQSYPDATVYPSATFRTEWGPIFHRGRLDGSARILLVGQDPGEHENVARRILVGAAGHRVQGLLAKLGITTSYTLVNALLYSAYDQQAAKPYVVDANVVAYRNQWLDALLAGGKLQAIIALGGDADDAMKAWRNANQAAAALPYQKVLHPTADAHPPTTSNDIIQSWKNALTALAGVVTPDGPAAPTYAGTTFDPVKDLAPIPAADLPAGVPHWMRDIGAWASRHIEPGTPNTTPAEKKAAARYKRRHILVEVPDAEVP